MGIHKVKGSPYWQYSFTIKGKGVQRGSTERTDKQLARNFYIKARAEALERRDFKKPSKITVRELLDWTNRNYWHYEKWESEVRGILGHFGATRASEVSVQEILDYRRKRIEAGIAKATINRDLALLKAAYNYGIDNSDLYSNPICRVEFFNTSDNKRDKFLRPHEKKTLIEAAEGILREIILFALKTGMRQGEILGLKWENVDTERKQIKVISYKGGQVITRYVPIYRQVEEILANRLPLGPIKSDYVFYDRHGRPLSKNGVVHSPYMRLIKRIGIQGGDFRFHDLRHTFASDYLMMGGTLSALQDILGHTKADTTRRYAHLSKEHLKVEMDRLPYENYQNTDRVKNEESPIPPIMPHI